MPVDIIIPSVGESVTEGVLSRWTLADGQAVAKDDIVAELETDKVTLEIRSPEAGSLRTVVAAGSTVKIGQVIGSVAEGSGAKAPAAVQVESKRAVESAAPPAASAHPGNGEIRITPLAEKLAKEHNIDLGGVAGTGAGGRIREQDVQVLIDARSGKNGQASALNAPAAPVSKSSSPATKAPTVVSGQRNKTRERMTPLRQRIAARLVQAQHTAAMLTTFNEVDMSAVMELRKVYKEEFEKKHAIGLGFMGFFVKAVVGALRAFPLVNASIVEDETGALCVEKYDYQDIAVAVGTPKGLVVPVVRNCETLTFAQIESGIKDLATRARDGKLGLEEMQGGTFTITNGGIYGSLMSTPILNPPQSAILGMHAIKPRAIEYPTGSGQVAIRPMMYLALSYDHRIIDGAEAVQFLVKVKQAIEDPQRLLLGL
jgi:2-oxoglutarate dehydrogenase E2 component (dihydrolipoamide succinyltransferase)